MFKLRTKGIFVPVLVASIFCLVFFQNCAQQGASGQHDVANYGSGLQKIQLEPNTIPSANICFEGKIKCYKKVYSPDVTDEFLSAKECTSVYDKELCVDVDINIYDTREALALCSDCSDSASLPNGRYNRNEVTCWLHVGVPENQPFYSVKSSLKESLTDVLNSCQISLLSKGDK